MKHFLTRDLVLIGGGHTHALVMRMWGMNPLPGARLTVINPGPTAPYSGMLPGFVAGHYSRDALDIDLVDLARFAGARIVVGAAHDIDLTARTVHVAGRPPISYDVLSVDIGITSAMPDLPGFSEFAVPAKPLGPFADRWGAYRDGAGPASVAVIGGGVAGAELAMAMAHALKERGRPAQVHLVDRSAALSVLPARPRAKVLAALNKLGVTLLEQTAITGITAQGLTLANGQQIEAAFVTGAAGTYPYPWLGDVGLAMHDGFVKVNNKLQASDKHVYSVGDCAHMEFDPRPKAGVFAVRQAPVLFHNLRAALSETQPKTYQPQKDYLKLISLGGKRALAEKAGIPLTGGLMWRWKDHIDQVFMNQFKNLPDMSKVKPVGVRAAGDAPEKPLCTGCGAKIGRHALRSAVADLPQFRSDVMPLPGDDAAVLTLGGQRQVFTTDHLSAVTDDPVLMARIAAIHALGDIWAMGASPQAALAQVTLPRMSAELQARTMAEIMQAAGAVMAEAGAQIVGGHSAMGDALTIGFSLTGLLESAPRTLAGAQRGDALILTKPIGTGVVLAGLMSGQARGEWVAAAWRSMTTSQTRAAEILQDAHAMTDVTGFGLAGHAQGMAVASGMDVHLRLADIPLLPGAETLAQSGVRSSLYDDNRALVPEITDQDRAALLFDPQTAGGLLAAVPGDGATELMSRLKDVGLDAAIVGEIHDGSGRLILA